MTIERTQISGNLAIDGGGVNNNSSGTINIVNSTISGNTSSRTGSFGGGGGIYNNSSGPINVNSTTIVLNSSAGEGGGVKINSIGQVTLSNTVVANNTAPTGPDCVNTPTSAGHNLIGDASGCSFTPAVGDLVGTSGNPIDPFFGPLQDNDGPTETHALPLGSPAVDAGDNVACPATDQRGVSRPLDGGGGGPVTCDIGAFEFSFLPTPIPTLSQWGLIVLGGLLATVFVWRMVYPTRIGGWRRRIL